MWPVIFSIGALTLRTFPVLMFITLLLVGFVFWRKGREEHYDEYPLFDSFILANVWGFLLGRIVFIALHFSQFGLNPIGWLALTAKPGLSYLAWAIGTIMVIFRTARHQKWDEFEVLDFWALALSFGQILLWLGLFLDGSGFGFATSLPIGLRFPGLVEPRLPVQLLAFVITILLFFFLSWAEYHYRRFGWYRHQRHSAQTGFLFAVWLIVTGLLQTGLSFLKPAEIVVAGVGIDVVVYTIIFIIGLGVLLNRSGRLQTLMGKK